MNVEVHLVCFRVAIPPPVETCGFDDLPHKGGGERQGFFSYLPPCGGGRDEQSETRVGGAE